MGGLFAAKGDTVESANHDLFLHKISDGRQKTDSKDFIGNAAIPLKVDVDLL
jgi:hypothetical protein